MNATEAWDRLLAIPADKWTALEKIFAICPFGERLNLALIEYWRIVDELQIHKSIIESVKDSEWEEMTGECLMSCGGNSIDGHTPECVWNEWNNKLAELKAKQ